MGAAEPWDVTGEGKKCDLDRIEMRDLVIVKGVIPCGAALDVMGKRGTVRFG